MHYGPCGDCFRECLACPGQSGRGVDLRPVVVQAENVQSVNTEEHTLALDCGMDRLRRPLLRVRAAIQSIAVGGADGDFAAHSQRA